MSIQELQQAILALDVEQKKELLLATLPVLSREVMQDRAFLMQLLPVFLEMIKDSGVDMQQLLQFAAMLSGGGKN